MGFKLKGAPYDKSNMNIAVYKKDLTDGSIGKSNHTGIILKTGLDPETEQHVIAHEKVHQEQQAKGDLDYDKENFYWKGKTYPRENLNEHNEELPWEKEAYKASEESTKKQANEMGSTKFKLKGHRGNNKPFSQLTSRGLIGASMNDTDGYNQPDYGSSMDNTIDMSGGSDVMQEDGASKGEPGSNYTRKEKRIIRKSNKCVKGVDGGGKTCKIPGNDDSSTKVSKDSKYKVRQSQVDIEKTTKGTNVQEVGIGKDKGSFDTGTTPSSKSGQTKAEYISAKGGKGNSEMAGRFFDKHHQDDKTVKTGQIIKRERSKIDKKGNETFDRGVKTTTTIKPSGTKGKVTDLKVSKKKLIGKGIKSKSYTSNSNNNKKVTGVKTLSEDKLQNKARKEKRKVKGFKDTERDLKGNRAKTRKGNKTAQGLGLIKAGDRSTGNPMLR